MSPVRFLITFSILFCLALPASAQSLLRREQELYERPVDQRLHPELRADGLNWHGFVYKPQMAVTSRYNSNVRALNNGSDADYSVLMQPEISVQKQYDGHVLAGNLSVDIERFADLKAEDKEDVKGFLRGNFNLNSRWSIPAGISFSKQAKERSAPQQQALTKEPTDTHTLSGNLGVTRNFNRLSLSLIGAAEDITHDDGTALSNGTPVIFRDDDRTNISGLLRARYGFLRGGDSNDKPEHMLFADFKLENQDYKRRSFEGVSFSGASGDNTRYGVFSGFETAYKGLLFATLGAGYTAVKYDDATLDNVNLMTLRGEASYLITPRLELSTKALRRINQDNDFAQGYKETSFSLGIDYEAAHDLYLFSEASYSANDFIGTTREDDIYSAEIGLRYHNSHRLETRLGLSYDDRHSNQSAQEFDRTQILLSLIGKI